MITNTQLTGDPMKPDRYDLIAQVGTLAVGDRFPEGWRVLTGNERQSQIARVAYRVEIEEGW